MDIEEMKKYLENNGDNPEVKALIDSLSDKRVNQARQTWERDLPKRIDTEIAKRQEREQARQERRAIVAEQLGEHFTGEKLDPEWCEPFLPADLADIEDEQIPEIAGQVTEKVKDLRGRLLTERYTGKAPTGGGQSSIQDPRAAEFRRAMGLKS